ncbi:MAG: glycosyltransferase [Bacteroidales bacterium]
MKISGFTIVKNAVQLDFPALESIQSLLPLVDEMIIVLGKSEDNTADIVKSIDSPKVKIIETVWDTEKYPLHGNVYASQTDIALKACTGDWCVYIQADEVLHENAIPIIRQTCEKELHNAKVEGLLLEYVHIYGDYEHYIDKLHFGYPLEIRIVRNLPEIHSWRDAQSFRKIPNFDYINYSQKKGTHKLRVKRICDAEIFHYGWSRDPRAMVKKMVDMHNVYHEEKREVEQNYYDYGNLLQFPLFKKKHPSVMEHRVKQCNWKHLLRYGGTKSRKGKLFGLKYRIVGFIEKLLGNRQTIGGLKNYILLKK